MKVIVFPGSQTIADAKIQAQRYGAALVQKGSHIVYRFEPAIKRSLREQSLHALGLEVEDFNGDAA